MPRENERKMVAVTKRVYDGVMDVYYSERCKSRSSAIAVAVRSYNGGKESRPRR